MNKFILINENDVISTLNDLSEAKATASEITKETGKSIMIAEIKFIAKTMVIFEEISKDEVKEVAPPKKVKEVKESKEVAPPQEIKVEAKEPSSTFDFEAFKNKLEKELQNVSSLLDHIKIVALYEKEFKLLDQEQTKIITEIKKETCTKAGVKDLSIELSGTITLEKDLISILNRYPNQCKEDPNIIEIVKDIRQKFKPSLSLETIDEPIEENVFSPKEFEEKIRTKFSEPNVYSTSRLEEYRDLLLSEYKDKKNFNAMKSIIWSSYYEKLANMGKSGVKYIGSGSGVVA